MTLEGDFDQRIAQGFDPFVNPGASVASVRKEIANHLATIARTTNSTQNPERNYIQGTRRRYLDAVRANHDAEQRLLQTQDAACPRTNNNDTSSSNNLLSTCVNVLELQKQHRNHKILSHYVEKAEDLAHAERVLDAHFIPTTNSIHELHAQDKTSKHDFDTREHIRQLETAVLRANHEAQLQKRLLIDTQAQDQSGTPVSSQRRLKGLVATRTELTDWVEHSLAMCDLEQAHDEPPSLTMYSDAVQLDDEHFERQYDSYIEARTRLLEAVTEISQPLTRLVDQDTSASNTRVAHRYQPKLPVVEARHLPIIQQNATLQQHENHLKEIIAHADRSLSDELSRLSEESHLLPSYPILAANRKLHQRSRSGIKQDLMSGLSSPADNIARLIEAWAFADQAAQIASNETVNKECKEGQLALDEVMNMIELIQRREDAWSKLIHG